MKSLDSLINITTLFIIFLIGLVGGGIYLFYYPDDENVKEEVNFFCGTSLYIGRSIHAPESMLSLDEGKLLFRNNCASCHNKDMKSDMTGPALSGAIKRFDYDTISFLEYVQNTSLYLDTKTDERLLELQKCWSMQNAHNFEQLTQTEIVAIIQYIEMRY